MTKNVTLSDIEHAKFARFVQALLEHESLDAASAACGISRTTGYRWLARADFQAIYRNARERVLRHAVGRLQSLATKAITALSEALENPETPPQTRVTAARAVLELAFRAHELDNLESRLEALEQSLKNQNVIEGQEVP